MRTKAIPTADAEFSNVEMLNPDRCRATETGKGGKQPTFFQRKRLKGAVSEAAPANGGML